MSQSSSKGQKKGGQVEMHPKKANFQCTLDEDAVTVENNGKIYELSMDARNFKPEEIKIKITPTHVIIDGFHETEEEITECNEEIVIPDGVLPSTIECLMNANGVLRIRGPIQPREIQLIAEVTTVTKTKEVKETRKVTTTQTIDETSEEVKVVETTLMDAATEAKILQDKKFVDSSKEITSKDGKLEMNVDVRGLKEEDIKVSVSKRIVAIQAVSKDSTDKSKEFHKKYLIPEHVDPSTFKSFLKKGVLTVSMADPKTAEKKPTPAPVQNQAPPKPSPPTQLQSQVLEPKEVEALERRCEDVTKQVTQIDKKEKKFEAKLNVSGFKAEELKMKITRKVIIVHTHQESKTTMRHFNKKISIPTGVRPEAITNMLTPDNGILTISAPIVDEPQTPVASVDVRPQLDLGNTTTTTDSHFEDISKQIANISGGKKFEVEFDVSDFKPEEIEIKILKSIVTIKGTQTIKEERQSGNRQFFKKFSIPQGVNAQDIKCTFTTKGTLRLYAVESVTEKSVTQEAVKGVANIKPQILSGGMGSTSGQMGTGGEVAKFERKIDAAGYKEDEIKITIANGWITITGKQEMGPELNFQTRQFTKKFSIPYGIKAEAITCNLQANGTLVISANN